MQCAIRRVHIRTHARVQYVCTQARGRARGPHAKRILLFLLLRLGSRAAWLRTVPRPRTGAGEQDPGKARRGGLCVRACVCVCDVHIGRGGLFFLFLLLVLLLLTTHRGAVSGTALCAEKYWGGRRGLMRGVVDRGEG